MHYYFVQYGLDILYILFNYYKMNKEYEWNDNKKEIVLSVGMPLYKSEKIVLLALEGLRLQKDIDFGWELIIIEEFGNSLELIKKFIGKLPNCQRVYYLKLKNRKNIPLSTKWIMISKKTSDTSNIFVMQDSDDFSPNRKLYIHKEHFKNKDCVLSSFTKGIFYNIHTKQVMIYNYRNKRSYNLLHAVRPSYIKNIKDPKVYRLIFSNFFLKIKPENIYKDYTIDKDNWKTGLFTDGYNTVSVSRRRLYNNPSNGFIRCNKKVLLNYPKYLFNFI